MFSIVIARYLFHCLEFWCLSFWSSFLLSHGLVGMCDVCWMDTVALYVECIVCNGYTYKYCILDCARVVFGVDLFSKDFDVAYMPA